MKQLFNTYTNQIYRISEKSSTQLSGYRNFSENKDLIRSLSLEIDNIDGGVALQDLMTAFDIGKFTPPTLGDHPDFAHIRHTNNEENHYIVSMFIDIKGSTNFYRKYSSSAITLLTKTIVKATTQICSLFNGHIQRIMGDGVFVYFGGKNQDKNEAVNNSVNAAAILSYFIQYELNTAFEQLQLEPVQIKIGIDFGDDSVVTWYLNGIANCGEVTTSSLHTSLASKMHNNAPGNGIVVGKNMVDRSNILKEFSHSFNGKDGTDESKFYIYSHEIPYRYQQLIFIWRDYLLSTNHFVKDEDGNLRFEIASSNNSDSIIRELNSDRELLAKGKVLYNSTGQPIRPFTNAIKTQNSFYHDGNSAQ